MTEPATTAPDEYRRPPVDWGRAAEGIQLAGFAVFLLLNTTGVLPWSFWLDAIALWPVLIMSAGSQDRVREDARAMAAADRPRPRPRLARLGGERLEARRRDGPWTQQTRRGRRARRASSCEAELFGARLQVDTAELDPALLVDGSLGRQHGERRLETHADGEQAL